VTLTGSPRLGQARRSGTARMRLIRAEILKIRTTSTWPLFPVGVVAFTALALWTNGISHHYDLYPPLTTMNAAGQAQALAQAARARTPAGVMEIAANMITAGQFIGVLFAMLAGVQVITSEFAHQTATATFLTTPRRTAVIVAKLGAAAFVGALLWLVSTVIDLAVTPVYLHAQHVSIALAQWALVRSVLLNLLEFILWAILGLGLGAIVRSQIGSALTGLAVYLAGLAAVQIIFHLIYDLYPHGWVLGAPVIAPAVASTIMITPGQAFPHAPPQWTGLIVMAAYALALSITAIAVTSRRDIT
jgi:ABC-2 type transport system permease protein